MIKTLYRKESTFIKSVDYAMTKWDCFDYSILNHIYIRTKSNRKKTSYGDVIIMADTETSKKEGLKKHDNHIVAWSIAIRAYHHNIVCLWGQSPYDFNDCLKRIRGAIASDELYIFYHNLSYDWIFQRKFYFEAFGYPTDQLNTRPLNPLYIKFENGIILKDSLALAQRSLAKWAKDLNVEHQKALGKWDYNKPRNQSDTLSDDELLYIQNDVLSGVECLDATCQILKKTIGSIPYTATGIVRGEARAIGRAYYAHKWFTKLQPDDYNLQLIFENLFNGGYTHGNRACMGYVYTDVECYDESSAYPFVMLTEKYACEKFWKLDRKIDAYYIINNKDDYCFVFKMKATKVRLHDKRYPMPILSRAKCQYCRNETIDNGRIISCSEVEIYYNELDLESFIYMYDYETIEFSEVYVAAKDYLPRWFTDYVFERYKLKTNLKGVDDVQYAIEKAKLNSCYGLTAQKPVKPDIKEDYITGDFYEPEDDDPKAKYDKYLNNYNSFLPYTIAPWVTAYARRNLFLVGSCVADDGIWLYSDTDSVFATKFNKKKIEAYNKRCKRLIKERGYSGVEHDGITYHLGVVELDKQCMQFKALHSKCYCYRPYRATGDNFVMGDDLKITVAGVPKKGAKSLENNIHNFRTYFLFDGKTSGKLQHTHCFVDNIYKDRKGNWTGDSIDLEPADYIIGDAILPDPEDLDTIEVQIYDEDLFSMFGFNPL